MGHLHVLNVLLIIRNLPRKAILTNMDNAWSIHDNRYNPQLSA